jgi:hypothetical protein
MASIHEQIEVEVTPDKAWAALREVGDAHKLFTPVLADSELNGDTRTVRFTNGMVARERILDVDEDRRRVTYTALDVPGMTYHHASMEVRESAPGRCLFVWITDFLPRELTDSLQPLIDEGARALKRNLEAA